MLKYINENLQVGDPITIESKDASFHGEIVELNPVLLRLHNGGKEFCFNEKQITGLKYYETEGDHFPLYIQKVFPEEVNRDYFFGVNAQETLSFKLSDGILKAGSADNIQKEGGRFEFPDFVELSDRLYKVEVIINGFCSYPDTINAIKLPKHLKQIQGAPFEGCTWLNAVHVPHTVLTLGRFKVGGCTCCELRDMNGQLLDWEIDDD
ncbi:MAG: hypothetical protein II859_08840 [Bacteroidales bacterium]|nr:hypothetical protein [Bacteroidales bacterium]